MTPILPADGWADTVNTLVGPGGLMVTLTTALVVLMRLNAKRPLDREQITEKFTGNVQETYRGMVDDLRREMRERDERNDRVIADLELRVEKANRRVEDANRRAERAEASAASANTKADRNAAEMADVRHNLHEALMWVDRGASPPPPPALAWLRTWARTE